MRPRTRDIRVVRRPLRAAWTVALALVLAAPATALAQGRDDDAGGAGQSSSKKKSDSKVFDFTAMDLSGRLRTPQLLYFLDRASEELQRASLERRSFIPEMVRSIDEEPL